MTNKKPHIIKQVNVELSVPASWQQASDHSSQLNEAVQAAADNIEAELDQCFGESLYHLDSLSVELEVNKGDWSRLTALLEEAVFEAIIEAKETADAEEIGNPGNQQQFKKVDQQQSNHELLKYFLQTGRFPWWAEGESIAGLMDELYTMSPHDWLKLIIPLTQEHPSTLTRLVAQSPEELIHHLVEKSAGAKDVSIDEMLQLLNEADQFLNEQELAYGKKRKIRTGLFAVMLSEILDDKDEDALQKKLVRTLQREVGDAGETTDACKQWLQKSGYAEGVEELEEESFELEHTFNEDERRERDDYEFLKEDEFTVSNAGLVLLHPFMKSLFTTLALVDDGAFVTEEARERGVCLLYYLATGTGEFSEHVLTLPKFLCSWPMNQPVDRFLPISDFEKEECRALLQSAIDRWQALKHTSPEELQSGFLQRTGSLKKGEFGWTLYIERKTRDILLEQLPWGLSVIKHEWMDKMLTIQW